MGVLTPQYSDGDTILSKALSFGWDVKPRSWLSVVIKHPMMSHSKRVEAWPWHPGQTSPLAFEHHGLLIIPIHWLTSSLFLLFTSKLWWAFWRTMAAVASFRWMLHIGGGWGDTPWQWALWVLRKAEKHYINTINYYYYYYYYYYY